ncbi:type I restriction endonuclease subunit R, EcoR124 family [Clostridioides difficile]
MICFRELSKILSKLQTFVEFEFKEEVLVMSEQEYQDFKSKYFTIYDSLKYAKGEKVSILSDIDFCIELMHTDKINVSYIMNLIRDIDLRNKNKRDSDIKYIVNELGRADNEELRLKVDLIKEFLEKVVPKLTPENSIDVAYNEYEEIKKEEEISEFAKDVGLDKYELKLYVSEYEYSGILNKEDISSYVKVKLKPKLIDRRRIVNTVVNFVQNHVRKFTL